MMKRLLAVALCSALSFQGAAQAYAAVGVSAAGSASQGLNVPAAPVRLSPLSIGGLNGLGASAPSLALQGSLPGLKTPEVKTALPSPISQVSAAPAQRTGAVATANNAVTPAAAAPAGTAAARSDAPKAAAPVAAPASITPAVPGVQAALAPSRAKADAHGRAAAAARTRDLGLSAAPVLDSIRNVSASASSQYAAGHRLADILTGQKSRSSADEVRTPVAAPQAPALSRSGLRQGEASAEQGVSDAATPTPAPELTKPQKRNFWLYALAASTTKVGIETLNLVVPILLLTQYGTATMVGTLFICSELAGMVASWLSGPTIDRFKPTRVMAAAAGLQVLFIGAIPLSFALGIPLGLPAIFTLFTIDGALIGVFDTARRAALPHIVGRNEEVLRKHNAYLYIVREILSVSAVGAAGLLLSRFGALQALAVHPAAYIIVALFLMKLLSGVRETIGPKKPAGTPKDGDAKRGIGDIFHGLKTIAKDPVLRLAAAVNVPVVTLHRLMHAILATVYATKVLGNPAYAAIILMAWNAGELAAAAYLNRTAKATGSFDWLKYIAGVSLLTWAWVAFPNIWVAAAATFFISTGNMSSELGLTSFFQSIAKKEEAGSVIGVLSAMATAASMAGLLLMGQVFDLLSAGTGFTVIAGIMTLMSVLYLAAYHKFKKLPPPPPISGVEDD